MRYLVMILAVALVAFAVYGLTTGGFEYSTQNNFLDLGPLHATVRDSKWFNLPAPVSITLLVGGVLILLVTSIRSLSHK